MAVVGSEALLETERWCSLTPHFIAQQLARPSGPVGMLVSRIMNRRNAKMNAFAVRQMRLNQQHRVLEIGFGGGVALPSLLESARFVAGVDRSKDVVRRARSTFSTAVASGRAAFFQGEIEALPFEPSCFDKVLTVNTVYFWTSLAAGVREIHRVLAAQGQAVVGLLPEEFMERMRMPSDIFTMRRVEDVVAAFRREGFEDVRVERPDSATTWAIIVASVPDDGSKSLPTSQRSAQS